MVNVGPTETHPPGLDPAGADPGGSHEPVSEDPGPPSGSPPTGAEPDAYLVDDVPGSIVRAVRGVMTLVGKAIRSLWAGIV
jgi:hypothetical protein